MKGVLGRGAMKGVPQGCAVKGGAINKHAVCILLECFLVLHSVSELIGMFNQESVWKDQICIDMWR